MNEAPLITIQPSKSQSTTNMAWRRGAEGYNAPPEFFTVFGRLKLTLPQIKDIAGRWVREKARTDSATNPNPSLDWFKHTRAIMFPDSVDESAEEKKEEMGDE